jgi:hypothetical protein
MNTKGSLLFSRRGERRRVLKMAGLRSRWNLSLARTALVQTLAEP